MSLHAVTLVPAAFPGQSLALPDIPPFTNVEDGRALTQAIVDTIHATFASRPPAAA